MRVTSGMYYESLYGTKNNQLQSRLFDVNKQIASGLSIQYASDDIATFTETMRLDNEMSVLGQIKTSTESGYKLSNQTDVVLNEFDTTMGDIRTLLINAANGTHSDQSLDAIADELRVLEDHLKNLANTSINGQYLFSGSAVDIKPISASGEYMGNEEPLKSFLGSNVQQQYNISGADLFLGEEVLTRRTVTTNVVQTNLSKKFDYETKKDNGKDPTSIRASDTIRDLMGDKDGDIDTVNAKNHFYLSGVKSNGVSFNKQISLTDDATIEEFLDIIGQAYGNTPNLDMVNVSLNTSGQIVIEDKIKGSSKLEFHLVGAVDYDHSDGKDDANVTNIRDLDSGEMNFSTIMNGTSKAANSNLYVKEFIKSPYESVETNNISGLLNDNTKFTKNNTKLTSSIPQIVRKDNTFATPSTKISDVADISKGTVDSADDTLDGNSFRFVGKNIYGKNYDVKIDYASAGTTFSLDTNGDGNYDNGTYDIYDMGVTRGAVDADEMTYQQLMDVMNMVITDNLPVNATVEEYDKAVASSKFSGNTYLTYDGKIEFGEMNVSSTKAETALYDLNSGDFSSNSGAVMSFNANNALVIRDAKTDFFKEINEIVTAVENHKDYPDDTVGDMRNTGIQGAIVKLDDLYDHINRSHSVVGAQSNALTVSLERTGLLEISTMTLRSSIIDTDLAEASLKLTQLTLNYESMLSTVGKVSKLSLVNYL